MLQCNAYGSFFFQIKNKEEWTLIKIIESISKGITLIK